MGEGRERKSKTNTGRFPQARCIIRDNQTDESKIKKTLGLCWRSGRPNEGQTRSSVITIRAGGRVVRWPKLQEAIHAARARDPYCGLDPAPAKA